MVKAGKKQKKKTKKPKTKAKVSTFKPYLKPGEYKYPTAVTKKLNEHIRNSTTDLPLKQGSIKAPELAQYYIALDKSQGTLADTETKAVLQAIARNETKVESPYVTGLPIIGDVLLQ